jgi:hypothetical protein
MPVGPSCNTESKLLPLCYVHSAGERIFASVRNTLGHATALAVSCWLTTMVAWVRTQVRSCGILGGQIGTGPELIIYHMGADTIGQIVANISSGLSLTPPRGGGDTAIPYETIFKVA